MTTTSVSADELAGLLASLGLDPPAPAAPAVDGDQAAIDNATQVLAAGGLLEQPPAGPIAAMPAKQAAELDALWEHPATQAAVAAANADHESIDNVPAVAPAGPPPSTVGLMRDVLRDLDASRPRSLQKNLGPSELGTPCQRQIAMKLARVPEQPSGLAWAPLQGTSIHGLMEEALQLHNKQLGRARWVIEEKLQIDDEITGHGDAFDTDTAMVVDWKYVGTTALRDVKRKTVPNADLVKPEYRVQAHLYGLGHERAGREVRWVRLVFLARSHDYNDSAEWTEAYDPDIAIKALLRYYGVHDLLKALDLPANAAMWDLVPAAPGKSCAWCPFRRVGGPADATGCPGDTQTKIDKQVQGLIA